MAKFRGTQKDVFDASEGSRFTWYHSHRLAQDWDQSRTGTLFKSCPFSKQAGFSECSRKYWSYFYSEYNTRLSRFKKKNAVSATISEVVSQFLRKRRKVNSTIRIPIPCNRGTTCDINVSSAKASMLTRADLIAWYRQIIHTHNNSEAIYTTPEIWVCRNMSFGRKSLLFPGDSSQFLSVVPRYFGARIFK